MNHKKQRRTWAQVKWIIVVAGTILVGVLLVACSTSKAPAPDKDSQALSSEVTSTELPTSTETIAQPPPTNTHDPSVPTLPSRAEVEATARAGETAIARHAAAVQTDVALTPRPGYTPFALRTQSPEPPTPTWAVGQSPAGRPYNTFDPEFFSCWNGTLNDKLLRVCAGHEQFGGDPEQGVLDIMLLEQDQETIFSDDVYETPGAFGLMHIVAANSNSVTIASEDGQHVFTFDIATRQWVSNPPLPSPSLPPVPTLTTVP